MITKPDPEKVKAAINADPVYTRLKNEIDAHKDKERERIAANEVKIANRWLELRKLKAERKTITNKIRIGNLVVRNLERKRKMNLQPVIRITHRMKARAQVIARRVEDQFLHEQRMAFRKEVGL